MFLELRNVIIGLFLPVTAIRTIIRRPSLLVLSLIPIAISFLVFVFLHNTVFAYLQNSIIAITQDWIGHLPFIGDHNWIRTTTTWSLRIITELIFFVLAIFTFATTNNICALPFNDFLAERSEQFTDPKLEKIEWAGVKVFLHSILVDLWKSVLAALGLIACAVISFVPIVNLFAIPLGSLLLVYQFACYPQTRRGYSAWAGCKFIYHHWGISLGLGLALFFGFAIPGVALIMPPIAIVSATILHAKASRDNLTLLANHERLAKN